MDVKIFGQIGAAGFNVDAHVEAINNASDDIHVHMMTVGGTALYGLSIFDALKESKQKTFAHIYGFAYSAGSVISSGCDHVSMSNVGSLMIHGAHGGSDDVNTFLTDRAIAAYHIKTKLPKEQIAKMMEKDYFLDAAEALELGFIDEIMNYEEAVAVSNIFQDQNINETTNHKGGHMPQAQATPKQAGESAATTQAAAPASVTAPEATQAAAPEATQAAAPEATQAAAPEATQAAAPEATQAAANVDDLTKYMASFGDAEGAAMFRDGVPFEAAQQKHITNLSTEVGELKAELAKRDATLAAAQGNIGGDAVVLGTKPAAAATKTKLNYA